MSPTETTRRTALFDAHVAAGGKIVPFAGYELPVQYGSVIAECKAVRDSAGMFDVSHMARLWFRGSKTLEFLEWITANDVAKLADYQGQYSLLPNEQGGCVDDIIVYRVSEHVYRMVVNAANHEKDVAWIKGQNKFDVAIEDDTDRTAMIAVQGPEAVRIVSSLSDDADALQALPFFGVVEGNIAGVPCFTARSGYTGEDGLELICSAGHADRLWGALRDACVAPCGLAARDALRVEAGLPLYGHELSDDINPIAAGLGWVVSKTKQFIGSDPINSARQNGTAQKLQGVRLSSKRLLSPGMKVFVEQREVGEVTSGVYSVLLECGIGFAFVDSDIPLDTPCEIDMRGKMEPATIVSKRFYKRK